jgi:HSP20 family protein
MQATIISADSRCSGLRATQTARGPMATDEVRFPHVLFLSAAKAPEPAWQPKADVYRVPDGWLVKLELAGVDPDDVRVATRGNVLCVQGTRRDARLNECIDCHRLEIEYSRFERMLELPGLRESAGVDASYRDGMLLIRIQTEERR